MIKHLLLAGLLAVAGAAHGQAWRNSLPIDSTTHRVTYSSVVEVPGISKLELYSRAREWFAVSFGSSKAVLEMDDREVGKLVGKANEPFIWYPTFAGAPCRLWRTIIVEMKEGRYRYTISDFALSVGSEPQTAAKPIEQWAAPTARTFNKDGSPKRIAASLIDATQATTADEINALRVAMTKPAATKSW